MATADVRLTSAVIPGVSIVHEKAAGTAEGTTYDFVIATDGKLYGLHGFLVLVESDEPFVARQNDRGQYMLKFESIRVDFPIRDSRTKELYRTSTPYGPERDRINDIAMQIFANVVLGPMNVLASVELSTRIR